MNDRWELITDLYHAALQRPLEDRSAFLRQACGHDSALQQEIESLLLREPAVNAFLETPAAEMGIWSHGHADPTRMLGRQLGSYQIVALLGAGGMGEVYRARDLKLGRDVAIKILPSRFSTDSEYRARLAREARILATLSHPHIATIYGVEEGDGGTALVLELVEGPTLADRLASGPLSTSEALAIALQIGDALHAAHIKGIVHRDLKPSNVVVQTIVAATGPSIRVRVLDFGLSKLTGLALGQAVKDHPSAWLTTEDGRIAGTPAYMSPEQVRGQPVDERSDIWAFGCIVYELFAGRRAFEGDTAADTFARILGYEPDLGALRSDTPAPIRRLLERCLQKDPHTRFRDIADAVLEIDDAMHRGAGAPPPLLRRAPAFRRRRHRKFLWLSAALGLAAVAAAVLLLRTREVGTAAGPVFERLTSNPSDLFVTSAHISWDGRHLAFADRTGLQVRNIDNGQVHRFPDTEGMEVYGWTPDSAGILASRCDDVSCVGWVISLVGQDRHRTGAAWPRYDLVKPSPDGQRLLRFSYATMAKRTLAVDPMNGSPPRIVGDSDVRGFAWSADGTRILIVRTTNNTIESVPADGGTPLEVYRGPKDQRIIEAIELPDRTILMSIFPLNSSPRTSGQSELWRALPDRSGVVREAPRRLPWSGSDAISLTVSSNGRVAFLSLRIQSDVYLAEGDLRNGSVHVPRRFTLSDSNNVASTWTPDSSAILFSSTRNGTWDIFKQPLDSDIAEPFVSGVRAQSYPGVTNDGQWVLYADGTGRDDSIMRVSLSGGAAAEVVSHVGRGVLQCAQHGRCVLLQLKDRSYVISSVHHFEGKGSELARIPVTSGFRLLPDGDRFAYVLPPENGIANRVRVISFTGKPGTDIVVKDAVALVGLGWLPRDSGFLSTDRGKLLLAFPDGTSKVLWAPTGLASIDWAVPSPDERHLAINVSTRHSNAWMVSGF